MKSCSVYEGEDIKTITGNTLRPGGYLLTDQAIEYCGFKSQDRILDIGCGMGATVNRLISNYQLNAFGIDPSEKLIKSGFTKYGKQPIVQGNGESLPYENSFFQGVMAECSMSLMESYDRCITESRRVLTHQGFLIISDVYARNPEYLVDLQKHRVESCMRALLDIDELKGNLRKAGFEILCFEDYTQYLKELMVRIIFKYGSMSAFWETATCQGCGDFQEKLSLCKPGYFLLIARKFSDSEDLYKII